MAKRLYKSFRRLEIILSRQAGPTKWGSSYQPANTIADGDVPRGTRPSALWDPYLNRFLQAQAITERPFLLLARHNQAVFDVHEQHMLPFNPSPHPLSNHESMKGRSLPQLRGTIAIAESMGWLNKHPRVSIPQDELKTSRRTSIPFPFIGDILIFLRDSLGCFAINWSVKATEADFYRTFTSRHKPTTNDDRLRAERRHELERRLFADGNIPTLRLHPGLMDEALRVNLLNLFYWYSREPQENITPDRKEEVIAWYSNQLPRIRVMHDLSKDASKLFKLSLHDAKWVLKSGIFRRQLRVDLFHSVADNLPLRPEATDPFELYADWFRRPT